MKDEYLRSYLPEHLKDFTVLTEEIILLLMAEGLPLESISFCSGVPLSEINEMYNSGVINGETNE